MEVGLVTGGARAAGPRRRREQPFRRPGRRARASWRTGSPRRAPGRGVVVGGRRRGGHRQEPAGAGGGVRAAACPSSSSQPTRTARDVPLPCADPAAAPAARARRPRRRADVAVARLTDLVHRADACASTRWLPLLAPGGRRQRRAAPVRWTSSTNDSGPARFHDAVGELLLTARRRADRAARRRRAVGRPGLGGRADRRVRRPRRAPVGGAADPPRHGAGLIAPDGVPAPRCGPDRIPAAAARDLVRELVGGSAAASAGRRRSSSAPAATRTSCSSCAASDLGPDLPARRRGAGRASASTCSTRPSATCCVRPPCSAARFPATAVRRDHRPARARRRRPEPRALASSSTSTRTTSSRFRREIHREVAYQQLTFRRRRDVHRRAAAALERLARAGRRGAAAAALAAHLPGRRLARGLPHCVASCRRGRAAPVRQRRGGDLLPTRARGGSTHRRSR